MIKFNVRNFIKDLGGAKLVAKQVGVVRTAPYGWINQGFVSTRYIEKIIAKNPGISIDQYFENKTSTQTRKSA